jgi:hypothetical protein
MIQEIAFIPISLGCIPIDWMSAHDFPVDGLNGGRGWD